MRSAKQEGQAMKIYKVTDAKSSHYNREGILIRVKGDVLKILFAIETREGTTDLDWHFEPSQVEFVREQ
jgi:hypothetical protein